MTARRAKGGRRGTTFPRERRKRPLVTFTLGTEGVAAVELLAERLGLSKSGAVELALRRLAAREGIGREELQARARESKAGQRGRRRPGGRG